MTQTTHTSRITHNLLILACCLTVAACETPQDSESTYERRIIQSRVAKDLQFFDSATTILRPKELAEFTGLRYFPVDSAYRFIVPFERIEQPTTVLISKQKSSPVPYQQIGYVDITGPDTTVRLSVFFSEEMESGSGWIPFTDATSNIETYGGGRYLDIELRDDGLAVVDFNQASNPYCVYNAYDFNCAIPPASNRLTFRMPVGEKKALLLDG